MSKLSTETNPVTATIDTYTCGYTAITYSPQVIITFIKCTQQALLTQESVIICKENKQQSIQADCRIMSRTYMNQIVVGKTGKNLLDREYHFNMCTLI